MTHAADDREFDLVLWGATGFTGQLVAEHLREHEPPGGGELRWALGGRDEAKLAALRERLGAPELPIVLGDALEPASMDALARRTRVVCSTVGPYARYGSALVAACAEAGSHYCDLTGEVPWVRRMQRAHQRTAEASGARLVSFCGFDSVPSDLGVRFVQREARRRFGAPSPSIEGAMAIFGGGVSGGTVASMLTTLEDAATDREVRRALADPHALSPERAPRPPVPPEPVAPHYSAALGGWTAPFVMAPINSRVVRRSAALQPEVYGAVRYREALWTGRGIAGAARALGVSLGLGVALAALATPPLRRAVATRLPQPGDGPDRATRERGGWELRLAARPPGPHGSRGRAALRARVRGDRDPGYGSTARMLGEAALCLALDPLDAPGGFHTPATAMGDALRSRLEARAGLTFEVL